jgi:hypothetical protein
MSVAAIEASIAIAIATVIRLLLLLELYIVSAAAAVLGVFTVGAAVGIAVASTTLAGCGTLVRV